MNEHTGFYPEPIFRCLHTGDYMLMRDTTYVSKLLSEPIFIEKGFVFSPSIPTCARMLVPVNSQVLIASLPHDFLYQNQPDGSSQKIADQIGREVLVKRGEKKRHWMRFYYALRLLGFIAWENNKYRRKSTSYQQN